MNEKVNIQDLIDALAEKHGVTKKDAENFIKEFFLLIEEGLEKDKYVKIKGLGTFKLIEVDSRKSVNVNTGEQIEIQGHTKVSFSPENALKEIVNRPFAHFESVVLNDNVNFDDLAEQHDAVDIVQETEVDEVSDVVEESESVATEDAIAESAGIDSVAGLDEENSADKTNLDTLIQSATVVSAAEIPAKTEDSAESSVSDTDTETILPETKENEAVSENENQASIKEIISEEVVETDNQTVAPAKKDNTRGGYSFMKVFILGVMVVMLVCIVGILYMYRGDIYPDSEVPPMNRENVILADSSTVASDTLVRVEPDTLQVADTIKTVAQEAVEKVRKQPVEKVKKSTPKSFEIDSVDHIIVGTETIYTIKEGETLTKVALKFYGTKALWPYIVRHNPKAIKNPNNVPFGTKIKIPKLKKKQ